MAGVPVLQLRQLLRKHHAYGLLESEVESAFPGYGTSILKALVDEGYLELSDRPDLYTTTLKGGALVKATASRPVSRKTAERCLKEFLERVQEVRRSPEFLWKVKRVILFGSFLTTDKSTVSDVDLALDLTPKENDPTTRMSLEREHIQKAQQAGRRFSNFIDRLGYPQTRVRMFLKNRSHVLQLTDCSDGVLETATKKIIYEDADE